MTRKCGLTTKEKLLISVPNSYVLYSTFQGLRPDIPRNAHPKLLELMQRCWEAASDSRPSFSEITAELENLVQDVQVQTPTHNHLEP